MLFCNDLKLYKKVGQGTHSAVQQVPVVGHCDECVKFELNDKLYHCLRKTILSEDGHQPILLSTFYIMFF